MSKILSINAGSSSLKFQLFNMPEEEVIAKGLIERIGSDGCTFSFIYEGKEEQYMPSLEHHEQAVKCLLNQLKASKVIVDLNEIDAVGHRVVHGGEYFHESVVITDDVISKIEQIGEIAPLHNPPNLVGIYAFKEVLPNVPMVAVFDTAFHQTMPETSYLYSLPYKYYEDLRIRKYGFHGMSHQYVSQRAAQILQRPTESLRLITCHLGNGASIAAIEGGKSVETSMGFTPLAGVTMGTRSGDVDPAIIPYIMDKTGMTIDEIVKMLNKESGLLALSNISNDLRDIQHAAAEGNERAKIALDIFTTHILQYVGAYIAMLGGIDAIVFTAGIGENSAYVREQILKPLAYMGVLYDEAANISGIKEGFITKPTSQVHALVIPTNEEVMIARDTLACTETVLKSKMGIK